MDSLRGVQFVAERLGVSVHTVRAWIQRGLLASVKLGTRRLVSEAEIQRVMQQGINTEEQK
jgi:excisionase family DNA binding protein